MYDSCRFYAFYSFYWINRRTPSFLIDYCWVKFCLFVQSRLCMTVFTWHSTTSASPRCPSWCTACLNSWSIHTHCRVNPACTGKVAYHPLVWATLKVSTVYKKMETLQEWKRLRFFLWATRMDRNWNVNIRRSSNVGCFGDKVEAARLGDFGLSLQRLELQGRGSGVQWRRTEG